jgi:hypothetical protein
LTTAFPGVPLITVCLPIGGFPRTRATIARIMPMPLHAMRSTRGHSELFPANSHPLAHLAIGLLEDSTPLPKAVRLLGVSLSSLQEGDDAEPPQLDFGI